MGNADRGVLGPDADWPEDGWAARWLSVEQLEFVRAFEPVVSVDGVLFCHGSPRSDTEIVTALTPPERLRTMLAGVGERLVVGGHTHHQFAHEVDAIRFVNAGSVGLPYEGDPAARWLIVRDGVPEFRSTAYDLAAAVERMRATGCPMSLDALLHPPSAHAAAREYEARA